MIKYGVVIAIALFICTVWIDTAYTNVKQTDFSVTQSVQTVPLFWIRILGTILVAILLIGLFLYVQRMGLTFLEAALFVLVGGAALFFVTLQGYYFSTQFAPDIVTNQLNKIVSSSTALTSQAGAFTLCLGSYQIGKRLFQERNQIK